MTPVTTVQAAELQQLLRQLGGQPGVPGIGDPLRAGEIVPGRVMAGPGGERLLLLAGVRVPATLPSDVPLDRPLRFEITESSAERLVLRVIEGAAGAAQQALPAEQAAAQTGPLPWAAIPMPGGAQARLWLEPEEQGEGAARGPVDAPRTMVVRYDSPAIGRLDIVLRLSDDQLDVTALAAAGVPLATVRGETALLRDALVAATGRTVALTTAARTAEDVDVRA